MPWRIAELSLPGTGERCWINDLAWGQRTAAQKGDLHRYYIVRHVGLAMIQLDDKVAGTR